MTVHEAVALSFARWVAAYPSIALAKSTIDMYSRSLAGVDPPVVIDYYRDIIVAYDVRIADDLRVDSPVLSRHAQRHQQRGVMQL